MLTDPSPLTSPATAGSSQPIHWAMRVAETPPAMVNMPPAISRPGVEPAPGPSGSYVVNAKAWMLVPVRPLPNADQLDPFQRAMWLAGLPPAAVNEPTANSAGGFSPAPSSSNTASAN